MRSFVLILIYLMVLSSQLMLVLISIHLQPLCELYDSLLVWEEKENRDSKWSFLVLYWTILSTR